MLTPPSKALMGHKLYAKSVKNNKKRPLCPSEDSSRAKRRKRRACRLPNFSPEFYDTLPDVSLTKRALREVNRRNALKDLPASSPTLPSVLSSTVARFTRRGGPDLSHLRGYNETTYTSRMGRGHSRSARRRQRNLSLATATTATTTATLVTPATGPTNRTSAYDANFDKRLMDHNIYLEGHNYGDRTTPQPENLDDIIQALSNPRASLSPSKFTRSAFRDFRQENADVTSEAKVVKDILPVIEGNQKFPTELNLRFSNLQSITNEDTVDPAPDLYDGSKIEDIEDSILDDIGDMIIPTCHETAPFLPNFCVELKAPDGRWSVAKRQACLDGAIGARAMHSLQNYAVGEPVYDQNAYSFTSVYHAGSGTFQLYTHHTTAPRRFGKKPEYHMTQIKAMLLTGNRDSFVAGATAFRNARDMAKRYRQRFIAAANARVRANGESQSEDDELSSAVTTSPSHETVVVEVVDDDGDIEIVQDGRLLDHAHGTSRYDSDDNAKRQLADRYDANHKGPTTRQQTRKHRK